MRFAEKGAINLSSGCLRWLARIGPSKLGNPNGMYWQKGVFSLVFQGFLDEVPFVVLHVVIFWRWWGFCRRRMLLGARFRGSQAFGPKTAKLPSFTAFQRRPGISRAQRKRFVLLGSYCRKVSRTIAKNIFVGSWNVANPLGKTTLLGSIDFTHS